MHNKVAIEVFNRQELKFVISRRQYHAMLPMILQHMRLDKHNTKGKPYRLYNLYIDTNDFSLIRHSMSKPTVYKEKLRIRSYESLRENSLVFLEVKKRYKKITNKRRTKMLLGEAVEFVKTGKAPSHQEYVNPQVISEMSAMLQARDYRPTVYITYDRMAFHALDDNNDLRITFDANLISQQYGKDETNQLLPADRMIMEAKSCLNMPMWLVRLLDENGIYKQSFSKYGTEYTWMLQNQVAGGLQYV